MKYRYIRASIDGAWLTVTWKLAEHRVFGWWRGRLEGVMHTPGPWENDEGNIEARGAAVAMVYMPFDFPCLDEDDHAAHEDECQANARLVAAAPELLAACKAVQDDPGLTASANDVISAAIAKATWEPGQ